MNFDLRNGDCLEVLKTIDDNSVDSIITDPPYGLAKEPDIVEIMSHWSKGEYVNPKNGGGFMGKTWDSFVPSPEIWKECIRVLKPGGTALVFAGSRTQDLMSISMRFAGFQIKDTIMWMYGSGFPKASDISKNIDKTKGLEREVIGVKQGHEEFVNRKTKGHLEFKEGSEGFDRPWMHDDKKREMYHMETAPTSDEAQQWNGWKSHALKPSYEPVIMAMKPNEGNYAKNALEHGVSGLNISECRIGTEERTYDLKGGENLNKLSRKGKGDSEEAKGCGAYGIGAKQVSVGEKTVTGRFPANTIFSHHPECEGEEDIVCHEDCPIKQLDEQSGITTSGVSKKHHEGYKSDSNTGFIKGVSNSSNQHGGTGGASRFFYCAKTSKRERNDGLSDQKNIHPCVKPIRIMEYLTNLTKTPNGGTVLDPFMGSGTTGIASYLSERDFIGIEREEEYFEIAKERIEYVNKEKKDKRQTIEDLFE